MGLLKIIRILVTDFDYDPEEIIWMSSTDIQILYENEKKRQFQIVKKVTRNGKVYYGEKEAA